MISDNTYPYTLLLQGYAEKSPYPEDFNSTDDDFNPTDDQIQIVSHLKDFKVSVSEIVTCFWASIKSQNHDGQIGEVRSFLDEFPKIIKEPTIVQSTIQKFFHGVLGAPKMMDRWSQFNSLNLTEVFVRQSLLSAMSQSPDTSLRELAKEFSLSRFSKEANVTKPEISASPFYQEIGQELSEIEVDLLLAKANGEKSSDFYEKLCKLLVSGKLEKRQTEITEIMSKVYYDEDFVTVLSKLAHEEAIQLNLYKNCFNRILSLHEKSKDQSRKLLKRHLELSQKFNLIFDNQFTTTYEFPLIKKFIKSTFNTVFDACLAKLTIFLKNRLFPLEIFSFLKERFLELKGLEQRKKILELMIDSFIEMETVSKDLLIAMGNFFKSLPENNIDFFRSFPEKAVKCVDKYFKEIDSRASSSESEEEFIQMFESGLYALGNCAISPSLPEKDIHISAWKIMFKLCVQGYGKTEEVQKDLDERFRLALNSYLIRYRNPAYKQANREKIVQMVYEMAIEECFEKFDRENDVQLNLVLKILNIFAHQKQINKSEIENIKERFNQLQISKKYFEFFEKYVIKFNQFKLCQMTVNLWSDLRKKEENLAKLITLLKSS